MTALLVLLGGCGGGGGGSGIAVIFLGNEVTYVIIVNKKAD